MSICAQELQQYVIKPTLKHLQAWSAEAESLLLATAAWESNLGDHMKGRAHNGLGLFGITPQMHARIWDNYLVHSPDFASKIRGLASQRAFLNDPHAELTTNLSYACAIAYCIYQRTDKPLPKTQDVRAMAYFWRRYFHSRPQASIEWLLSHYRQYLGVCKAA